MSKLVKINEYLNRLFEKYIYDNMDILFEKYLEPNTPLISAVLIGTCIIFGILLIIIGVE